MRRLGHRPGDHRGVVCSHGHFDHTTGLDGLIAGWAARTLPVLIHPDFWYAPPGPAPAGERAVEIPATSRSALEGAGFTIVEEAPAELPLRRIGAGHRRGRPTTGYEPGFPLQEAWQGDHWVPDPLVLDDQAVVIPVRDQGSGRDLRVRPRRDREHQRYARRLTGVDRGLRRDGWLPPERAACSSRSSDAFATTFCRWSPSTWCPPTARAGGPSTRSHAPSGTATFPTASEPGSSSSCVALVSRPFRSCTLRGAPRRQTDGTIIGRRHRGGSPSPSEPNGRVGPSGCGVPAEPSARGGHP